MGISESPGTDFPSEHACDGFELPLRELAANILRIIRGGGRPTDLALQARSFLEAVTRYGDEVGTQPTREAFAGALAIELDRELLSGGDLLQRQIFDGRELLIRAALEVAASRLMREPSDEAAGLGEMVQGFHDIEEARQSRRRSLATVVRRAAPRPTRPRGRRPRRPPASSES